MGPETPSTIGRDRRWQKCHPLDPGSPPHDPSPPCGSVPGPTRDHTSYPHTQGRTLPETRRGGRRRDPGSRDPYHKRGWGRRDGAHCYHRLRTRRVFESKVLYIDTNLEDRGRGSRHEASPALRLRPPAPLLWFSPATTPSSRSSDTTQPDLARPGTWTPPAIAPSSLRHNRNWHVPGSEPNGLKTLRHLTPCHPSPHGT